MKPNYNSGFFIKRKPAARGTRAGDAAAIEAFIAAKGVTKCPPGWAGGEDSAWFNRYVPSGRGVFSGGRIGARSSA